MKKLRVGVIGCGRISQSQHIPNYLANAHSDLRAVCDIENSKLKEVKVKFGVQQTFTDYHQLLKQSEVDAVSVCVPTYLHSTVALDAISAGIHVLCEKPIALTLQEADKMIDAAKRKGVNLMIGFNYRFLPNHQLALKYIREGRIGDPFLVLAQNILPGPYKNFEESKENFYFDPQKGGGVLFDSGSHLFYLLAWMFGNAKTVAANLSTHYQDVKVDDVATVLIRFRNGVVGQISTAWAPLFDYFAMSSNNRIQILGSEGKIESDFFGPSIYYYNKKSFMCRLKGKIKLTPRQLDPKMPLAALQYSYKKEIDEFVRSVLEGRRPLVTGEDGRKVLRLTLAAYRSFLKKKVVSLE